MKRILPSPAFCALLVASVVLTGPTWSPLVDEAGARPVDPSRDHPLFRVPDLPEDAGRPAGITTLAGSVFDDTVRYGGTYWAADSSRWEALRDSVWTFDTGVGSSFGPPIVNKPAGYHVLMEGWFGIDQTLNPLPYFRRGTTCAIAGTYSFWAGVTLAEANALCYVSGQGYGNAWSLEIRKSFAYPGTGSVALSYQYRNESEVGFDYSYALIDTTGSGGADDLVLATYNGVQSGTATLTLQRGTTLRSTPGNVTLKFLFESDGSYSDEDGLNPTSCGGFAVDNVSLTGAIADFSDFETGPNGWAQFTPVTGVGDYSDIVDSNSLPAPNVFCRCGVQDSVLVFFDPIQEHPLDQDNIAASPWIDLKRGGDAGRPGKLITFSIYQDTPIANYVFTQLRARWYPSVCSATGKILRTPWRDQNTWIEDFTTTFCTPQGQVRIRDFSGVIEAGAEQVQIAVGMINLCRTSPFGIPCSGVTNTTPWYDNISLKLYGHATAPSVFLTTFDIFQDAFAEDGTLNPASTGRIDTNTLKNASSPRPGSILRDTLVVRGDGGNTEVRLVFHIRPGPFTSPVGLLYYRTRWTAEPSLGPDWYSARMDTAEQGGIQGIPRGWMATYHEADPGFRLTDRTPEILDPSQLENEILPDHLFTPGSRIDYFLKARYIPPDPRNVGGTTWYVTPDTTGGRYHEIEILPSSMGPDTTWNCTLYVDHHDDRALAQQQIEEAGLTAALGLGGANAEGTRYDRWDVETPSSGQLSFGRPVHSNYGASVSQAFAYKNITWHSADLSSVQLTDEDANVLGPWLTLRGIGGNRFWGSGDGLAQSMNGSGEPTTVAFMKSILGVTRTCNTVRDANCPGGTPLDSTYCIATVPPVNAEFFSQQASIRGNGCPDLRSFDLLGLEPSVATAKGQLNYMKAAAERSFASVTNHNTLDVDYRTVLDGFAIGAVRSTPLNPHLGVQCTDTGASLSRAAAILTWFGNTGTCGIPAGLVDVPGSGAPQPPRFRTSLGNAHPNPMSPETHIQFTNGVENGRISLQVFDVTGRLVKTLVDGDLPAGVHEITWDGSTDSRSAAPNGMYFYKLSAPGFSTARKIVVMR